MLCDVCLKNKATVHMTTFVGGQVKTTHLCPVCAAKKKKAVVAVPSMSDFMSAFYKEQGAEASVCERCGTTLQDFRNKGRLGCANCYKVFEAAIMPMLKSVHMNVKHTGKRPGQRVEVKTKAMEVSPEERLSELRRAMNIAVSTENFEEAARLRDEIALFSKEDE